MGSEQQRRAKSDQATILDLDRQKTDVCEIRVCYWDQWAAMPDAGVQDAARLHMTAASVLAGPTTRVYYNPGSFAQQCTFFFSLNFPCRTFQSGGEADLWVCGFLLNHADRQAHGARDGKKRSGT
jgi:hypothetical protein